MDMLPDRIQRGIHRNTHEKATAVVEHITYNALDERYEEDIFTKSTIKGWLGVNAMKAKRHLYDYIVYDSIKERGFCNRP